VQCAASGIVIKNGNGRSHLVNHIGEFSIGMQREVSRPGSGIGFGKWWIVQGERAFSTVKFVDQRFVETKIVNDSETAVGR